MQKNYMTKIFLPDSMDVIVVSFGGVGTTFLIEFLSKYLKVNDAGDMDKIKHSPLPPISFNKKVKYIYVYGNPQLTVVSLFRRGFHFRQSIKLQKWNGKKASPIPPEMSLSEYAKTGMDKFYLERHFYNWFTKYLSPHQTLFIRYESLFEHIAELLDFLELPKECINEFPSKIIRNSSVEDIPLEIKRDLDSIYGKFSNELNKLNDVVIRQKEKKWNNCFVYFYPEYRRAISVYVYNVIRQKFLNSAPGFFNTLQSFKQSILGSK